MSKTVIILVLVLAGTATAQRTRYVTPTGRAAADAGATRADPMQFNYFKNTFAAPGDTALLQVGDYTSCDRSFRVSSGTNVGSAAGGMITYAADTGSPGYVARAANWKTATITRPTTANAAYFPTLTVENYDQSRDMYLAFDKLYLNRFVFKRFGSHVDINDCTVMGLEPSDPTDYHYLYQLPSDDAILDTSVRGSVYGIYLFDNNPGTTSDMNDIAIRNCYVSIVHQGIRFSATSSDPGVGIVTITNCHITDVGVDAFHLERKPAHSGQITVDGCVVDTYSQPPDASAHRHTYVDNPALDGNPLNFTYTPQVSSHTFGFGFVRVLHNGAHAVRKASINEGAYLCSIACGHEFPWALSPGDEVEFWGSSHGAGINVDASYITVQNTCIRKYGATGCIYFYGQSLSHITIQNCLLYGQANYGWWTVTTADGSTTNSQGAGAALRIINNTIVGSRNLGYQDTGIWWHNYYGPSLQTEPYPGVTGDDWVVANNLLVGECEVSDVGVVTHNHVYCSRSDATMLRDGVSNNVVTRVFPDSSTPVSAIFDSTAATPYFLGAPNFDESLHGNTTYKNTDFIDAYHIPATSPARGAGSATYAPATDYDGDARGNPPDLGFDEFNEPAGPPAPPTPPSDPNTPTPADGAPGISRTLTLAWLGTAAATNYRVYLGTNSSLVDANDPAVLVATQTGTSYHPAAPLAWGTHYYWKVIAVNAGGDTHATSVLWDFTTQPLLRRCLVVRRQ